MAGNPIYGKDIYQSDGALEKLEQDLAKIDGRLKSVETSAKSLKSSTDSLNSTNREQRDSIKSNAIEADKLAQEHKKLKESYSNTAIEIKKIQAVRQKQSQIQKLEIQLARSAEGSYNRLSAQYSLLKIKLNGMSQAQRENTVAGRAMVTQSKELYNEMKRLQGETGKQQLNVGNYSSGVKQAAGSLLGFASGLGAAILVTRKLSQAVKEAVTVWTDYDKATSKVRAISGATNDEMKMLSAQAEKLGESTEKTAAEVSQLQLELAKLGFNPQQIQNATGSILDLSTAIDSDLAQSATVVGQVLRAYDLDAQETARVTDVMAAAFSKSSLDLSKFQNAMSTVAPVAKTFGFNVEETTALLAQLTDAGFDASSAGTALRNILLNLADSNGDLAKALGGNVTNADELLNGLDKLNAQGVDLNKTLQLTDKRSVAAFNRFLGATESTRKLTKELNEAAGAGQRMADIMRDNLAGDIDKAKSATQGLYINIGKRLNSSLREATQAVTSFVSKLNEYVALKPSEEMRKEQIELNLLVSSAMNANNTQESRNRLIAELQTKYPDFLKNMDAEKVTNEELRDRLKEVNAEYREKILQLTKQELIQKRQAELVKLQTKEIEYIKEITRLEQELEGVTNRANSKYREQFAMLDTYRKNLERNRAKQEEVNAELQQEIEILDGLVGAKGEDANATEDSGVVTDNTKDIVEDYSNTLKALKEQLTKLKTEKDLINLSDTKAIATKQQEIDALEELIAKYEELGKAIKIDSGTEDFGDLGGESTFTVKTDTSSLSDLSNMRLEEITAQHKKLQELEQQNVDSLFGIFSKYLTLRNAKQKNMNAEQIENEQEKNEAIADGLSEAVSYAMETLGELYEYEMEQAEQKYEVAQRNVDLTWNELEAEIAARELGQANNVATKQKEYEANKKREEQALKDKQKAAKQQQTIDSITQASSLITASANIWSSMSSIPVIGSILAIAAIALMWGSFAYAKVKANQVTSYGEGGTFNVGGGTHASGNDTSLGVHGNKERKVERGEKVGVIKAKAVREYGNKNLDNLFKDINAGALQSNMSKSIIGEADMPAHMLINAGHDTADLKDLEFNVKKIRQQGEEKWYTNSKGQRVRVYKNLKQTFIN